MADFDGHVLIDSNILIYAYDNKEPAKYIKAKKIVQKALLSQTAVLSVQNLFEFHALITLSKIDHPLPPHESMQIIKDYVRTSKSILHIGDCFRSHPIANCS